MPARDRPERREIGGKGYNLHRLQQDHAVPEWCAVTVRGFLQCLDDQALDTAIRDHVAALDDSNVNSVAAAVQASIRAIVLPDPLTTELTLAIDALFGETYVAVRSSAGDEDGADRSFAGIHESYLYVRGTAAIIDHVRRVWASGYQPRALLYRRRNALPLHPVPMAVVIQRMVEATTSGVVFTADPATQDSHRMVISALYGLGEGLVSAGLDADLIHYDKRNATFHTTIADKPTRYGCAITGTGVCELPVDAAMQHTAALSDTQVAELARTAMRIERRHRRPQDIEFCFDASGKLYLLQTRDITTLTTDGPAAGNRQIWDNSNIIESYSGITSPMTFSFIRHAYAVVYNCFSEVMGIPRAMIVANQNVYRNMLGLFKGQVYYNLPNWYRLVRQFPGYAYNKAFMESMMGVKETVAPDDEPPPPGQGWRRYGIELPKLVWLATRMLRRFAALKRLVPAFDRHFNQYYKDWAALDFKSLPPHELMRVYYDMERHLLRNWKTPIINDFYVMVSYGILKACCQRWCGDANGTLQNNLICGEGGIASTEPTRLLMRLAADIKADPVLRELVLSHTPQELLALAPRRPEARPVVEAIARYLAAYGFRCMNELKLEEPSLHDTPEFVYQVIINYVRMDDALLDVAAMDAREKHIRAEAEAMAFGALGFIRRRIFQFVLRHARTGVKNRENMRFARTKIYGLLRLLLHAMGDEFAREGLLDTSADIFYLTLDEVLDFIKGTAVTTNLRRLVSLRRNEFDGYRTDDETPDDHFETYGMAYHRNLFRQPARPNAGEDEAGHLQGVGCSPGSIEGTARVIHSPRDDIALNGEILVAARTDPGWVPLYPSVSGILIERGSILSHSAIVAREMGIPAIVGIPDLLRRVPDGQRLHMDAARGRVTLLN